jgi:TonB-dependent SusC/RagA subfamily outer membrane receptor
MSLANDTSYMPTKLPFRKFKFGDDGENTRVIEFNASKKRFVCDIGQYQCTVGDTLPREDPFVKSPDKKWEAFAHEHNLYIRPAGGGDSTRLTDDGVEFWSYGLDFARPNELVKGGPRRPTLRWSPDSKKIVVSRRDERGVEHMHYISYTKQRPKHFSQPYALPGDSAIPVPGLHVIDIEARTNLPVKVAPAPHQLSLTGSARDSVWSDGSDRLYVSYFTRASKKAYLAEVDAHTGATRILAGDSSKTFVEIGSPQDPTAWYVTNDGREVVWWSERDGWAHLYLVDAATGRVKNRITSGPWAVGAVQHVDDRARQVYFTARGREDGRNLYYAHLYRVNFDGSGLTLLTPEALPRRSRSLNISLPPADHRCQQTRGRGCEKATRERPPDLNRTGAYEMTRGIRSTAAVLSLLLGAATAVGAQGTGTVRGQVTAAATVRPLEGAQVLVAGTGRGSLTNRDGRFLIVGVPAGPRVVRVQLLGYGVLEIPVAVAAGQAAEVPVALQTEAVALEGIVVTGQPAATRRRAIGTSVVAIEAAQTVEQAAVSSLAQLLQGRQAGVTSLGASGTVGAASTLVLRGLTSLSQRNAPVVYLDGIRVDGSDKALIAVGGQAPSRLNDINPADIERLEIIKGAAATALYGTEASAGVIQIFTKRGRAGESAMSAGVKLGANRVPDVFPLMHSDPKYVSANDLIETGLYQEYNVAVRGGTEGTRHFVSGSYLSNEGSFTSNFFERAGGRVNLSLLPRQDLTADFSSSFAWSRTQLPSNDENAFGVLFNVLAGNPVLRGSEADPFGGPFLPVPYAREIGNADESYRFTGGITLQHQPLARFQQRLTLGLDAVAGEAITTWPYAPNNFRPRGSREIGERRAIQTNVDYSVSWSTRIADGVESTLSAGGQLYRTNDRSVYSRGSAFAAPGLTLLNAATASIEIDERQLSYTTGGLFVQEQLGFGDKVFATAGLRVDGSSAFGENFGLQAYPKADVSYVVSEERWFALPAVSVLRLRGGFGMAGMQPGAFDAVRTYGAFTANGGKPAIHALNLGNPDLAPEVSYEWEGGVDAGLLGDRLSLSATLYHQITRDALLTRTLAPSTGFLEPQLANLGEIRNQGLELSADAALFQSDRVDWRVNASYAYNDNEVTDLGGSAPLTIDRFGSMVREGFPAGGKWGFVTTGTDARGYPVRSDSMEFLGASLPPHTGALGSDVSFGALKLFANAQWAAGHVVNNHNRTYMLRMRTGREYFDAVEAAADNPANPQSDAVKQLLAGAGILGDFVEEADWLKLREIGLSYELPAGLSGRVGAKQAQLSLSARNLFTLTGYSGTDPEVTSRYDLGSLAVGADFFTVPQARQFVVGVNVQF